MRAQGYYDMNYDSNLSLKQKKYKIIIIKSTISMHLAKRVLDENRSLISSLINLSNYLAYSLILKPIKEYNIK